MPETFTPWRRESVVAIVIVIRGLVRIQSFVEECKNCARAGRRSTFICVRAMTRYTTTTEGSRHGPPVMGWDEGAIRQRRRFIEQRDAGWRGRQLLVKGRLVNVGKSSKSPERVIESPA